MRPEPSATTAGIPRTAWALALLAGLAMFGALAVDVAWPRREGGALAFWAPGANDLPAAAAIADAVGARVARAGGLAGWWVLAGAGDDAVSRLYHAGAWLVIDPKVIEFCRPSA